MDFNWRSPVTVSRSQQFRVTADDVVMLTDKGKDVAETKAFSGYRAQILMKLSDGGATSIRELASDTRIPIDSVKSVVIDLMRRAEVRKVGYDG